MKIIVLSLLVGFVFVQVAVAQSRIPAFPQDDAELVDPSLLDLTETRTPAPPPAPSATTTVKDSGTGTPTALVVLLAAGSAILTIVGVRLMRRRQP